MRKKQVAFKTREEITCEYFTRYFIARKSNSIKAQIVSYRQKFLASNLKLNCLKGIWSCLAWFYDMKYLMSNVWWNWLSRFCFWHITITMVDFIPPWLTSSPQWLISSPQWLTSSPQWLISSPQWLISSPQWLISSPQWLTSSPPWLTSSPPWLISSPQWLTSSPQWLTSSPHGWLHPPMVDFIPQMVDFIPPWLTSSPHGWLHPPMVDFIPQMVDFIPYDWWAAESSDCYFSRTCRIRQPSEWSFIVRMPSVSMEAL